MFPARARHGPRPVRDPAARSQERFSCPSPPASASHVRITRENSPKRASRVTGELLRRPLRRVSRAKRTRRSYQSTVPFLSALRQSKGRHSALRQSTVPFLCEDRSFQVRKGPVAPLPRGRLVPLSARRRSLRRVCHVLSEFLRRFGPLSASRVSRGRLSPLSAAPGTGSSGPTPASAWAAAATLSRCCGRQPASKAARWRR